MLSHLSIKNMAIIDFLEIDFNQGMTVLTGETGAGKSIIIDSISLLMGDRASSEMVRHEEEMAVIEGIFEIENNIPLKKILEDNEICNDEQLIIKRTIKRNGSGQIRVNGELISLTLLKDIGQYLVDIHVQHDTHRLFQSENNYDLIDNFNSNEIVPIKKEFESALQQFQKAKKNYTEFVKNAMEVSKKIDLMTFHRDEIQRANLQIGELEELEERRQVILNSDKLHKNYSQILFDLNGDGGVIEKLYQSLNTSQYIASIDETMSLTASQLGDVYYSLEEILSLMSTKINELNYSPEELDQIESRLNELQQLKRKYRMDIKEILEYYNTIIKELSQIEDSEGYEKSLLEEVYETFEIVLNKGELLNNVRQDIALQIEKDLIHELKDLQLYNTQFKIKFSKINVEKPLEVSINSTGLYDIQFLLSTNKGEPMKPLQKVASGGELSRIMLALKTILNRGQYISTIIFDEIDTGVSGQVASSIGSKMNEIAKNKQVLCISHLPQVASLANYHLHVIKREKNNRTVTGIKMLSRQERIEEIARMLSGDDITVEALENARRFLQNI